MKTITIIVIGLCILIGSSIIKADPYLRAQQDSARAQQQAVYNQQMRDARNRNNRQIQRYKNNSNYENNRNHFGGNRKTNCNYTYCY